jgi:hypothetical protein
VGRRPIGAPLGGVPTLQRGASFISLPRLKDGRRRFRSASISAPVHSAVGTWCLTTSRPRSSPTRTLRGRWRPYLRPCTNLQPFLRPCTNLQPFLRPCTNLRPFLRPCTYLRPFLRPCTNLRPFPLQRLSWPEVRGAVTPPKVCCSFW